jgi:hypothetical protein
MVLWAYVKDDFKYDIHEPLTESSTHGIHYQDGQIITALKQTGPRQLGSGSALFAATCFGSYRSVIGLRLVGEAKMDRDLCEKGKSALGEDS